MGGGGGSARNRYILRLLSGRRRLMWDDEKYESVGPGKGIKLRHCETFCGLSLAMIKA